MWAVTVLAMPGLSQACVCVCVCVCLRERERERERESAIDGMNSRCELFWHGQLYIFILYYVCIYMFEDIELTGLKMDIAFVRAYVCVCVCVCVCACVCVCVCV